jgi:hypothetical protein
MGKKSGSGMRMNNPDNVSESLEKFFCVKILKCESGFRDEKKSGFVMEKIPIRDPG